MTSVGESLRRERLRRKVELAQVAKELKISSRMLEAIEADEYDKLPGGVFAKSFVRQYADLLGLDAEEVASQFEHAAHLPELTNLAELRQPRPVTGLGRLDERRFSVGRPRSVLSSLIAVVLVMLICSVVYGWWQRNRQAAATRHSAPPTAESAASRLPSRTQAPAATTMPANPAPAQALAPGAVQPAAFRPGVPQPLVADIELNGSEAVHVELVVSEPVWVSVQRDGRSIYKGQLQPNEIRTLAANNEITLKLGNAGGVKIVLNGKEIPPPGEEGQVRTVQLTSGGFQIVPPAASAPAPAPALPPKAPAFLAPL